MIAGLRMVHAGKDRQMKRKNDYPLDREELGLEYWPPVLTIHESDYKNGDEYNAALSAAYRHYDFFVHVDGGIMYFEFETDLQIWQKQR